MEAAPVAADSKLVGLITSDDPAVRNTPLEEACAELGLEELIAECEALEQFRKDSENLYERVRALFFLYAIHRFVLPPRLAEAGSVFEPGLLPYEGFQHLLSRRFREAIDEFLESRPDARKNDCLASGLAAAYYQLGLQNLADQVRRSVRTVRGNQWMFRVGHPADHPLRIARVLREVPAGEPYPILHEQTSVRMDLSHSSWSDIFFLGMDYPECARVLNVSINLTLRGEDQPRPPCEAFFRVIDKPIIRLVSVDLEAVAEIASLEEVFDFARDYLGLLKAALIAAGVVPPGLEGSGGSLEALLEDLVGPGKGFELVSCVNNIPKGSRLAVSTNLLGALISVCMRATGQTKALEGMLEEPERRLILARAILGEWLGGSGGGWQDSGGVWPGIKAITGSLAETGDPEHLISRGRLLPTHRILGEDTVSRQTRQKLQESLILVHGGMAQNVGPILEMVTEKYLLRSGKEWEARQRSVAMFDEILAALEKGDIRELGRLTTEHFDGPLQAIIPWANNAFTQTIRDRIQAELGEDYWGFWMLGGMSGGGMGFIVAPEKQAEAKDRIREIMTQTKRELERALPFAMDPVVYDFSINERGSDGAFYEGDRAILPPSYFLLMGPRLLRTDPRTLSLREQDEIARFGQACERDERFTGAVPRLFRELLPAGDTGSGGSKESLDTLLERVGFDDKAHEAIRQDMIAGRIGLAQNRLPASTRVEDVRANEVTIHRPDDSAARKRGEDALAKGEAAVVTLAAGAGSRWTGGAGVVKALHPFARFGGQYRSFLEVHLAKSRAIGESFGVMPAHFVTTGFLTHEAIESFLAQYDYFRYTGPVVLSFGRSIGLRLVPMVRDLRYAWEETAQQVLDERAQKVRESVRAALIGWAQSVGEGSDYRDNVPRQCVHPVGHWYEIPNLLLNGTLAKLLSDRPQVKVLLLHNIDTLGANLDPVLLGQHLDSGSHLTFEVITRRIEDHGGGLARIDGRPRLVEGMALPDEADEFKLSYYNSATCWITIDALLGHFGLSREDLEDRTSVAEAVRRFARELPTYVTLKDVKKRWGRGQEDVFPVAQFEKLWGDMSSLPEVQTRFVVVPRVRGQQLKDQAQLDGWLREGSCEAIENLCRWA